MAVDARPTSRETVCPHEARRPSFRPRERSRHNGPPYEIGRCVGRVVDGLTVPDALASTIPAVGQEGGTLVRSLSSFLTATSPAPRPRG